MQVIDLEPRARHLVQSDLDAWTRNGWLVLAQALTREVRCALASWVEEIARPTGAGDRRLHYSEQTENGPALCRTERYIDDHAALRALLTRGVLPEIAAELIGAPAVLYKEKVNYKPPGGAGFNPHQDATAYAFVQRHVTCMVAVDAMTVQNGCLEFSPHVAQTLLPQDGDGCIDPGFSARLEWWPVEVPAGGVVFFTSHVPHRSASNSSKHARRALYLTYNAASEGDKRAEYYAERDRAIAARGEQDTARVSTIGHFRGQSVKEAL